VILLLICIFAVEVFLRAYNLAASWTGIDTFYHLIVARHIREDLRLPKTIQEFLYHGPYSYPPLLHIMLAFIPYRFSKFIPVACDLLHATLVFGLTSFVSSDNPVRSFLAAVLYLSVPVNYVDSLSVNPRPIGSTLLTASIFSLLLYPDSTIPIVFAVLYGLMLLTHKMAVQVSWFVLIGLAISVPLLAGRIATGVALSIVSVTLLTKGFYWKIFREHLRYLNFHIRFGSLSGQKLFPSPIMLLKSNPFLLLLPLATIIATHRGDYVDVLLASWAISTAALAALWRFGDADRFLAFGSSATAVMTAMMWNSTVATTLYIPILCYGLWRQVGILRRLTPPFLITQDLLSCFHFLRNEHPAKLLCLPLSYSYSAAYFAGQTVVAGDASVKGLIEGFNLSRRIENLQALGETIEEVEVGLVLVDCLVFCKCEDILENSGFREVYSTRRYSIFRRSLNGTSLRGAS